MSKLIFNPKDSRLRKALGFEYDKSGKLKNLGATSSNDLSQKDLDKLQSMKSQSKAILNKRDLSRMDRMRFHSLANVKIPKNINGNKAVRREL